MDNSPSPLAALLDELGMTQAELARRLGVGRTTINNWLRLGVPADQITPVCEALTLDAVRSARFARDVGTPFPVVVETALVGS